VPEANLLHSQAGKGGTLKVIIHELLSSDGDMGGGDPIRTWFLRYIGSIEDLIQCSQRGSPSVPGQDEGGRHCAAPHRPPPSSVVPRRLPMFSDVFQCFPLFSAVPCRPPPSPAVLCSYLPSPDRSCLRSWGSSSLLITAVLGIQGRGRTTFCRPVSSGGLRSPPAGSYGGPGRLRTLIWSRRPSMQ